MKSLRWLLCLLPMFAFACSENDPDLTVDERVVVLPGIDQFAVITSGGGAVGLSGRNGGGGGAIALTVQAGRLLPDNGAAWPATGSNFLTNNELDGGVVTYAELEALQTPAMAGTTATFTITGSEFHTPASITMDLSDAPVGVVDAVEFACDTLIRFAGPVRTRRAGANAVALILTTTAGAAVQVSGIIDTSAAATFDGGGVTVAASGAFWLRGWIDARGGAADTATDAGSGGNVQIAAAGDSFLRAGSLVSSGGAADGAAGGAGAVAIDVSGGSGGDFEWGIDARGGVANTGAGGAGGTVTVTLSGVTRWFQLTLTDGGGSTGSVGGNPGAVTFVSGFSSGILEIHAEGGSAPAAAAASGGTVLFACNQCDFMSIEVWGRGGTGDSGGVGGTATIQALSGASDSLFEATLHGGHAVNAAGNGGRFSLSGSGAGLFIDNVALRGWARGGNGANSGIGGIVAVDGATFGASVTANDLAMRADVSGGTGPLGGTGGQIRIQAPAGSVRALVEGTASAGTSNGGPGVPGGTVDFSLDAGDLDLELDVLALGGNATGFAAGDGGVITVNSAAAGALGGSTRVTGSLLASGGSADMGGGPGGIIMLRAGDGGVLDIDNARIEANGGNSSAAAGGDGGSITADAQGPVFIERGGVEAAGGAGSTATGTANGGQGGVVSIATARGTVSVATPIRVGGGSGFGAGGVGGTVAVLTDTDGVGDAGDIVVTGTINANGGQGLGGGNGGDGGSVSISASAVGAGGYDGSIFLSGAVFLSGGAGAAGGDGGVATVLTQGALVRLSSSITANAGPGGGSGGTITIGGAEQPALMIVAFTARIAANGVATGLAGFITLDPVGAAPNPALVIESGASLQTLDGDGTDRATTNQTLD